MKSIFRTVCFALLIAAGVPAWALQLGQIQVKSALNQPLVAAIPLHPENLSELDGLTVALAPAEDYARAGLQLTPTDRTLRFHVVTDNNGQKLILVTSSEPVTDPYLDFLVQVNTRQGRQVREFVVLLNPVIAAPAPVVQAAPIAGMPTGSAPVSAQPAELPPASAFPQPAAPPASKPAAAAQSLEVPPPLEVQPQPQPQAHSQAIPAKARPRTAAKSPAEAQAKPQPKSQAKPAKVRAKPGKTLAKPPSKSQPRPKTNSQAKPQPKSQPKPESQATGAPAGETVKVAHGDTLYGIAKQQAQGTNIGVNQLMLALKSANPEAFFKNNINDLKAGAILRIPTRDAVDRISVAEAGTEVRRQYEAWRAARPHAATVVEGTAAEAAANAAPKPAGPPASDHLTLVPPTGGDGGASNRPGVKGGTGKETVTGLQLQLQNGRDTLVSLNQSNADLESRVRSLEDITSKTGKLLSLKDATIAELQHKLAVMQSGAPDASSAAETASGGTAHNGNTQAESRTEAAANSSASPKAAGSRETNRIQAPETAWFMRPLTWLIAGLIVVALILIGLFGRRRGRAAPALAKGPLPDPEDVAASQPGASGEESSAQARIAGDPGDLAAHLALCRVYYTRGDAQGFVGAATAMYVHVADPACAEWREVTIMGDKLAQDIPSFEAQTQPHDPYGLAALREPANDDTAAARAPSVLDPDPDVESGDVAATSAASAPRDSDDEAEPVTAAALTGEPDFTDDPIDTKLDLARAYLDMGDPVGARAMLEEVLEEGSQTQKDEATRLLAEVSS